MALHPGALTFAYAKLQECGLDATAMQNACEQAAYRGSFTLGRTTVTFDKEAGYQVTVVPFNRSLPVPAHGSSATSCAGSLSECQHNNPVTADSIITAVTQAPTAEAAKAIMEGVRSSAMLAEVADLLYIEADGHGKAWLRIAIVAAARS